MCSTTYVITGAIITGYQTFRGWMLPWRTRPKAPEQIKMDENEVAVLYRIPDAVLYLVTTATGFVALDYLRNMWNAIGDWSSLSIGTAIVIVFLAGYSVLGITGKLARIVHRYGAG